MYPRTLYAFVLLGGFVRPPPIAFGVSAQSVTPDFGERFAAVRRLTSFTFDDCLLFFCL